MMLNLNIISPIILTYAHRLSCLIEKFLYICNTSSTSLTTLLSKARSTKLNVVPFKPQAIIILKGTEASRYSIGRVFLLVCGMENFRKLWWCVVKLDGSWRLGGCYCGFPMMMVDLWWSKWWDKKGGHDKLFYGGWVTDLKWCVTDFVRKCLWVEEVERWIMVCGWTKKKMKWRVWVSDCAGKVIKMMMVILWRRRSD